MPCLPITACWYGINSDARIDDLMQNRLIIGTPISAFVLSLLLLGFTDLSNDIVFTLAITLVTAVWWVTEALPVPATSLVPFFAFPLFGVLTHKQAAASLGSHVILLMMGGFMMAKALEHSGLHRRFALMVLRVVGSRSAARVLFAFMLVSAFLSMWISNTATCLMLMPIALAVLNQLEDDSTLAVPLMLGIAYACSLGGIATLIGTPPNVIFAGMYEQVTGGSSFGFLRWLTIGLPVVVIGLPLMVFWLMRHCYHPISVRLPETTPWQPNEKRLLAIFALVIFLWVFRTEPFGGWSDALNMPDVGDSTVALLGAGLMFLVAGRPGEKLLDWKTAVDIPWGVLLLFASGITLATAFTESGLSTLMGEHLSVLTSAVHPLVFTLILALSVSFITEVTSNIATTTLLMPVLGATAVAGNLPPEQLMIPAAISASCAFMLPVATAPNAIVYGSGKLHIHQMMREGVALNILLALVITGVCYVQLY